MRCVQAAGYQRSADPDACWLVWADRSGPTRSRKVPTPGHRGRAAQNADKPCYLVLLKINRCVLSMTRHVLHRNTIRPRSALDFLEVAVLLHACGVRVAVAAAIVAPACTPHMYVSACVRACRLLIQRPEVGPSLESMWTASGRSKSRRGDV